MIIIKQFAKYRFNVSEKEDNAIREIAFLKGIPYQQALEQYFEKDWIGKNKQLTAWLDGDVNAK
jgi:predicted DNA binding CopG/RHH family protein